MIAAVAAATFLYGLFLRYLGDAMPFVDSFTTVSSVAAMIVSVKMYAEQWWILGGCGCVQHLYVVV